MALPNNKKGLKSKGKKELREKKPKLFSFRWFKGRRAAKDMDQAENQIITSIPSSKSWDTGFATADHLSNLHDEQEKAVKSASNFFCKLCLVIVPDSSMYTLQDCHCVFCIACLCQYITINIRDGNVPITCPDAGCSVSGKILASEIKEIAGDDALSMFERYTLNLDVELDLSRVWCPAPGCETICNFQPSVNPDIGAPVYCSTCRLKFCSLCKLRWHEKMNCDENTDKVPSDNIALSGSDEEIKKCLRCKIPVVKEGGCAIMKCKRCKHLFCWHCLASLDNDILLRHYNTGLCKNKSGHTRAQTCCGIGLLTCFCILLLLASPFLLLASPCLICFCKKVESSESWRMKSAESILTKNIRGE